MSKKENISLKGKQYTIKYHFDINMNKELSTYERKMKDRKFKKAYDANYKELLFSELIIAIMEEDNKSVRKLAQEANLSPSVIQELRAGKQTDIKVTNLLKIANALGFELVLEKGEERLTLHESIIDSRSHISAISAPHPTSASHQPLMTR